MNRRSPFLFRASSFFKNIFKHSVKKVFLLCFARLVSWASHLTIFFDVNALFDRKLCLTFCLHWPFVWQRRVFLQTILDSKIAEFKVPQTNISKWIWKQILVSTLRYLWQQVDVCQSPTNILSSSQFSLWIKVEKLTKNGPYLIVNSKTCFASIFLFVTIRGGLKWWRKKKLLALLSTVTLIGIPLTMEQKVVCNLFRFTITIRSRTIRQINICKTYKNRVVIKPSKYLQKMLPKDSLLCSKVVQRMVDGDF